MQQVCLNQLAAEENHVTEVAEIPGVQTIDFEKNRREAERVFEKLWYTERSLKHHVDVVDGNWITDTEALHYTIRLISNLIQM